MSTSTADDSKSNSRRRPGRFDPDQPLHMTTRRAARKNGSTPSLNGSVDDGDSRRGSFDDYRPPSSNGSQSASRQRLSNASERAASTSPRATKVHSSPSSEPNANNPDNNKSLSIAPYAPAVSPWLKRKRSSSPPSPIAAVSAPVIIEQPPPDDPAPDHDPNEHDGQVDISESVKVADDASVEPTDAALDVPASQVTEAASEQSSQPSDHNAEDEALPVAVSTDETPLISPAPSPASSMSDRDRVLKSGDMGDDAADSVAMADVDAEEGEAMDGAEDVDDLNDDDGPPQTDDDGTRPRRKMGGRRRAAHPNPKVEAAMRRQAELKSGYRAVSRQLKLVLLEITHRTLETLKADEESHLKATEYETVKAGLHETLMSFRQRIETEHEFKMNLIARELNDEREVRTSRCRLAIDELQDQQLASLEHRIISIERQAQATEYDGNDDTDDEDDDVVPKIKKAWYRHHRGPALDPEYDSRSRVILETQRMTEKLEARMRMARALRDLARDDESAPARQFTVMDATPRLAAIARQEERAALDFLVHAAVEEEKPPASIPVIPNSEALGLQILGELASRPSILAPPEFLGQSGPRPSMVAAPQLSHGPAHAPSLATSPEGYRTPIHQMSPAKSRIHTDSAGQAGPDTLSPPPKTQPLQPSLQMDRISAQRPFRETLLEAHPPLGPPPFQPLRLPGYPGRQFEFAPDDVPHYRHDTNPPLFGNFRHALPPPPPAPYPEKTAPPPHEDRSRYERRPPSPVFNPTGKPLDAREEGMPSTEPKDEPPSRDILNRPAGQSGSAEDRFHVPNQQSPAFPAKRSIDAPKSPRPSSGSATETTSGNASRRGSKTKPGPHRKTNKEERGGASGRQSKFSIKRPHGHSQSSGNVSHVFQTGALNPAEQAHLTPAWDSANPLPQAPPSSFGLPPPPYYGAPPPPPSSYGPFPPPPPLPPPGEHGHRGSISALPPFPSGWPQQGPPGGYPLPPPPDHWNGPPPIPPPPYPGQHPGPGRPPGSSGSGSQQYGGPALAPASQAPRNPSSGAGASHLPAFAQQQRNGEGQRRRTQSDSQPKIHQWTPGGQGRR